MIKRLMASLVCVAFIVSNIQSAGAQDFNINQLPVPGTMVGASRPFAPLALKGLVVNPQKPLEFQFIVDTGDSLSKSMSSPNALIGDPQQEQLREESSTLIRYFLAGLTIPEGDLWVNLSPYEKNRMVPEALGQTGLGRDLLAQDYILKQLTASLIYPEKDLGKEFWSRVYAKAQAQFGTTNVPVNTFNKVWILPDQAQVFEKGNAVYVTKSTLKVMLDEDYLAKQKHQATKAASISSQIVRQIILPEIEKEVNTGKNFAPLRQIYSALILAKWYKETIQNSLIDAVYTNKKKIAGVNLDDPSVKEQIYDRYLQAYKKGAFNYIKEDPTPDGQVVPRKYFSGGLIWKMDLNRKGSAAMVSAKGWAVGVLLLLAVSLGPIANPALAQSNTPSYAYPTQPAAATPNSMSFVMDEETQHSKTRLELLREHPVAIPAVILTLAFFALSLGILSTLIWVTTTTKHRLRNIRTSIRDEIKRVNHGASQDRLLDLIKKRIFWEGHAFHPGEHFSKPSKEQVREAMLYLKQGFDFELSYSPAEFQTAETYDGEYQVQVHGPYFTVIRGDKLSDKAMNINTPEIKQNSEVGGIDLNQIKVNRTGKTVNVQFDPAQLSELMQGGFAGFRSVITSMTRISSPLQLLGVNTAKEPEELAKF